MRKNIKKKKFQMKNMDNATNTSINKREINQNKKRRQNKKQGNNEGVRS